MNIVSRNENSHVEVEINYLPVDQIPADTSDECSRKLVRVPSYSALEVGMR